MSRPASLQALRVRRSLASQGANCRTNCRTCFDAVHNGHLECLQRAHEQGYPWNTDLCSLAARVDSLECLRYAHESGCPWDEDTCSHAAKAGSLECLQYAHENGCPFGDFTSPSAAAAGSFECLKYAHEHGCSFCNLTAESAAEKGSLQCLKYAHENGCPWNEEVCSMAATSGALDCLQYAYENGCPWTSDTCDSAAAECHLECLQYAHERGCGIDAGWHAHMRDDFPLDEGSEQFGLKFKSLKYAIRHNLIEIPEQGSSLYDRAVVANLIDTIVASVVEKARHRAADIIRRKWLDFCFRPGSQRAQRAADEFYDLANPEGN